MYYAKTHFRPIGKNGSPLNRVISPYDNTGYITYEGKSLQIFYTKEECIDEYMKFCEVVKSGIEEERKRMNSKFDEVIAKIDEFLID